MTFEFVSYDEESSMASFRTDGEVVRVPGLTRAGAENVLALEKNGRKYFLTIGFEDAEAPVLRFPRRVAMRRFDNGTG